MKPASPNPKPSAVPAAFDNARYATLNSRAETPEAIGLVDELLPFVEKQELASGVRRNKRGKTLPQLRSALESFLGDLLGASDEPKSEGWVCRTMKSDSFSNEPVSHRTFQGLVGALKHGGYIKHVPGRKRWTANAFDHAAAPFASGGRAAHFRAELLLWDFARRFGITMDNAGSHFVERPPDKPIVLKTGSTWRGRKKIDGEIKRFRMSPEVQVLEDQVKALNTFLAGFDVQGGTHSGYWRVFNEGDVVRPYGWNKGGRLYARKGGYQSLPQPERLRMTIDGAPVAEIDIRASYITVLHGLEGFPFDATQGDPYEVKLNGTLLNRDLVKTWVTVTLGKLGHMKRWPAKSNTAYRKEHGCDLRSVASVKTVRGLMIAKYPVLEKWGERSTTWADLMFVESNAMLGAMTDLMRLKKPSLTVHDSLIVRADDVPEAAEALTHNYFKACGITPGLKVVSP